MTPAACARKLGVSPDYVWKSIRAGKLRAEETRYASGRKRYWITDDDFAHFQRTHQVQRTHSAA